MNHPEQSVITLEFVISLLVAHIIIKYIGHKYF
jgi:hypothetical protein